MTPLTDDTDFDASETFGIALSKKSDARNHEYYGKGDRTRHVSKCLPDAPNNLRKRARTRTIKLKETVTKQKDPAQGSKNASDYAEKWIQKSER
ncbi:unnamed protein product [Protopolystoma xenopodis]|uniref:Uncharacterized protein n=1 Tax=Protopolystoma xenopodis TaxID=117903 RepID=A0A3S4ZAW8_9PLAT|nr:unnamed protein product [Protopolystoma xenopodis]